MKAIQFDDANIILAKPSDMTDEQCHSISAHRGVDQEGFNYFCVGFQPSPEDIEAFKQGRPLMIKVMGSGFPPLAVFTTDQAGNVNPELPKEPLDVEAIGKNIEKEKAAYLKSLPQAPPLEETANANNVQQTGMEKNMDKFAKHICPNPNKDEICNDCPKDGCYHE